MRRLILVLAVAAMGAGGGRPRDANRPIDIVGSHVGEGGEITAFWLEYQRVSKAADRSRYDALKRSADPYLFTLALYLAPGFSDLVFLESGLGDTRLVRHGQGCMIGGARIGNLAYDIIRGRSELAPGGRAAYSKQQRLSLARAILRSPALVHLHHDAGTELGELLALDPRGTGGCTALAHITAGGLSGLDATQVGVLLTSLDLPWRESDPRGEGAWRVKNDTLLCALTEPAIKDESKRYIVDYVYSRAPGSKEARAFHDVAAHGRYPLPPALAAYEQSLFETFLASKPALERLREIHTWREMDRHTAEIRALFAAEHPIMLADVLAFEPSTVLESRALRELKGQAVLRLARQCRARGSYYAYAAEEARLRLIERQGWSPLPVARDMILSAAQYQELKQLLRLDG